jgi:hypothetical protein
LVCGILDLEVVDCCFENSLIDIIAAVKVLETSAILISTCFPSIPVADLGGGMRRESQCTASKEGRWKGNGYGASA